MQAQTDQGPDKKASGKGNESVPISVNEIRFLYWYWTILLATLAGAVAWHMSYQLHFRVLPTLIPIVISALCVALAGRLNQCFLAIPIVIIAHIYCVMLQTEGMVILTVLSFACQFCTPFVLHSSAHRKYWATPGAITSIVVALVGSALFYMIATADFNAARKAFPKQSLASRLDYEQPFDKKNLVDDPIDIDIDFDVPYQNQDLDALDQLWYDAGWHRSYTARQSNLSLIHSQFTAEFIGAPAFGVGRAREIYPKTAPPVIVEDIHFDEPFFYWPRYSNDASQLVLIKDKQNGITRNPWRRVLFDHSPGEGEEDFLYHFASSQDFLDANSFGITDDDRLTAGFVEHAFHYQPPGIEKDNRLWKLTQLQLISLERFSEPRAYVLDQLPRMDKLTGDNTPTRKLNPFETGALEKLRAGQQVVVQNNDDSIEMFGALRSRHWCMQCHSAKKNELLGAFTYRFEPIAKKNSK